MIEKFFGNLTQKKLVFLAISMTAFVAFAAFNQYFFTKIGDSEEELRSGLMTAGSITYAYKRFTSMILDFTKRVLN